MDRARRVAAAFQDQILILAFVMNLMKSPKKRRSLASHRSLLYRKSLSLKRSQNLKRSLSLSFNL